jgi:hypothetical protein
VFQVTKLDTFTYDKMDCCPRCGRVIRDGHENGLELETGQRWCKDHYSQRPILYKRALYHVKRLRRVQAEYDEEVREAAKEGYRPHYCIHGMNLWVDWDVICGPCEDGYGRYEGEALYKAALWAAESDISEYTRRINLAGPLMTEYGLASIREQLVEWVAETVRESVTGESS